VSNYLICGKIDAALAHAKPWRDIKFIDLLEDIRRDAERMEAALVRRKDEVEVLKKQINR
jgi:predicted  nucleic acid-binding Zn-ribbon protein